jgi:Adenine-specific methyltransferase EcoRI
MDKATPAQALPLDDKTARPTGNEVLQAAKKAKQDEFYTQWVDIEREMNAYLEYDPDAFRDKTVLLPCDDPEWSNFTKFFALHFADLGMRKLISTSYAPESNAHGAFYQTTLFETVSPIYDPDKSRVKGRLFTLESKDLSGDGVINIDDLRWEYLGRDGDFRSDEVTALRDEADVVITNPPFSLWRKFVAWLIEGGKKFAIIGNQAAITYTDIFPLIQENRIWLGKGFPRNMAHFNTPYTPYSPWIEQEGGGVVRVAGVQWFTNIDHGRRHEPLQLMTMADNIKFSKHKEVRGVGYQQYVNFDAIEVPFTDAIPSDYDGVMGVPITFLTKYNPDQFEIIANLDDHPRLREVGVEPISEEFMAGYRAAGGTGAQRARGYWPGLANPNRFPFKRIFIRRKNAS